MMQKSDIRKFLRNESYETFQQAVFCMAVNEPELCIELLEVAEKWLERNEGKDFREFCTLRIYKFRNDFGSSIRTVTLEERLQWLVQRCAEERFALPLSPDIEEAIRTLYDADAACAIRYLLGEAPEETVSRFAYTFLAPERLSDRASVDVVVRPIADEQFMRGNIGRYLVFTRKYGEETLLKFTNQPSCVYYIMYLIDRKQHADEKLVKLDLAKNMKPFSKLYHLVYDIAPDSFAARFRRLLYREDRLGMRRVGRERECVSDVRQHLQENFENYQESFFPYAMTAHSHLSVSAERLFFEEDARKLLDIHFD